MKAIRKSLIFFVLIFLVNLSVAQKSTGKLQGRVYDFNTNEPVSGVLVRIDGTRFSGHTDDAGFFQIPDVPAGKYNLLCLKAQFYCTMSDPVEVYSGQTCEVKLNMLPGDSDKFLYISIGGITVTADRELIPESHETVHKITSAEIEHMQATNLGDVLDLIPGVERQNRPGLAKQSFVGLRGVETDKIYDRPDVFGTKVIVDEIPLSNNTNLNAGTGVTYGSNVTTNVGTGVDLRSMVADNIQEVEVVSGVPSVEYGDLTTGIVKVKTQSGRQPLRLKMKTNPDTREMTFKGGNPLFSGLTVNYTLNYAYSERDIRQDGDEVSRVYGQLKLDYESPSKRSMWQNRVFFSRLFEDYYLPNDPRATRTYGKDYSLNFGSNLEKKLGKLSRVGIMGYFNYTRRKNYTRKFQVIDPTYLSYLTEPGTIEGILTADPYFWEVNTLGKELALGLKVKMENKFLLKKMLHSFLYGIEYTYEDNIGPGIQFNPLTPPNGNTGERPRSFDEVPGFKQLSLFLEDRITSRCIFSYTLSLGVRGEMYNPLEFGGKDFIKSRNGTFWNPRMGIQIKLTRQIQIRSSYGITSKAPALADIYPQKVYHDVLEWGRDPHNPLDSIPLITTYVYPLYNENLQGFRQKKFELGLDYQFRNIGISITGYVQNTKGTGETVHLPYEDQRYFWPNWPSPEGKYLKSQQYISLSGYSLLDGTGWNNREGVELSLRTHRLPVLNMMFRISGAYNFKRHGSDSKFYLDNPRGFTEITASNDTISHFGYPFYSRTSGWRKSLIMNYNLDYINRTLGIWITLTMFHKWYEKKQTADLPNVYRYALGYYENGSYTYISPGEAEELGLTKKEDEGDVVIYRYPANFYFNLTVSKDIWRGMEVSLFVNNFLNSRGFYTDQYGFDKTANPEIFYGMEFSMIIDPFARYLGSRIF